MWSVKVLPFLELDLEGVGLDVHNSDSAWITSVEAQKTSYDNWVDVSILKLNGLDLMVKISDRAHLVLSACQWWLNSLVILLVKGTGVQEERTH